MKIKDITIVQEFYDDYVNAPAHVQKRVDKKVNMMGEVIGKRGWCKLPNSFHAHKVDNVPDLWIGYITVGNQGWRVLFDVDSTGKLWLQHLMSHDDMDKTLRLFQQWET